MAKFWENVDRYLRQLKIVDMVLLHVMLIALGVFIGALWGRGNLSSALWISIILFVLAAIPVEIKFWTYVTRKR